MPDDAPPTTPDGRYVVVDGRRWRATDPGIPSPLRAELVRELMAARRAVGAARGDDAARSAARRRVQDAKVALGERGAAWWDDVTPAGRRDRATATMRALLRARRPESSICPSDVARVIGGTGWRDLTDEVRRLADAARAEEHVRITQGDDEVTATARGALRLRRGPRFPDPAPR